MISQFHAIALAPLTPLADALALLAASRPRDLPRGGFEYGYVRGAGSAAFIAGSIIVGWIIPSSGLSIVLWLQAMLLFTVPIAVRGVPEGAFASGSPAPGKGVTSENLRGLWQNLVFRRIASAMAPAGLNRRTRLGPMKTKTTTSAATDSDQSQLAVPGEIPAAVQRMTPSTVIAVTPQRRAPASDGKRIMHGVAAENEGGNQDECHGVDVHPAAAWVVFRSAASCLHAHLGEQRSRSSRGHWPSHLRGCWRGCRDGHTHLDFRMALWSLRAAGLRRHELVVFVSPAADTELAVRPAFAKFLDCIIAW
jgi:hypothetical protein